MKPPKLNVVTQLGELPQYYRPGVPEVFPTELIEFTDRLHDAGHIDLAHDVLDQQTRMQRLIRYCNVILGGEQ